LDKPSTGLALIWEVLETADLENRACLFLTLAMRMLGDVVTEFRWSSQQARAYDTNSGFAAALKHKLRVRGSPTMSAKPGVS